MRVQLSLAAATALSASLQIEDAFTEHIWDSMKMLQMTVSHYSFIGEDPTEEQTKDVQLWTDDPKTHSILHNLQVFL